MALSFTAVLQRNQLDEVTPLVDAGPAAGLFRIYSGTPPANADTALSGNTLLSENTMSDPSFPAAAGAPGVLTASAITDDSSANATGTPSFFRLVDSTGSVVMQGTAGTSGTDLILTAGTITAGIAVSISSFAVTHGNP